MVDEERREVRTTALLVALVVATPFLLNGHTWAKSWWSSGWIDLLLWAPHGVAVAAIAGLAPNWLRLPWRERPWQWLLPGLLTWAFLLALLHGGIVWQTAVAETVRWWTLAILARALAHRLGPGTLATTVAVSLFAYTSVNLLLGLSGFVNPATAFAGGVELRPSRLNALLGTDLEVAVLGPSRLATWFGLDWRVHPMPLATGLYPLALPVGLTLAVGIARFLPGAPGDGRWPGRLGLALPLIAAGLAAVLLLDRRAPLLVAIVLLPMLVATPRRWRPLATALLVALPLLLPVAVLGLARFVPSLHLSGRVEIWSLVLTHLGALRWEHLWGFGFAGEQVLLAEGIDFVPSLTPGIDAQPAHSQALQAVLDTGWIGAAVLVVVVARLAAACVGAWNRAAAGGRTWAVLVVATWLNGTTTEILGPNYQVSTWVLLLAAAVVGADQANQRPSTRDRSSERTGLAR